MCYVKVTPYFYVQIVVANSSLVVHNLSTDFLLEQYHSCLKSRIRTEGSALQLGMQYFKLKDIFDSQSKL